MHNQNGSHSLLWTLAHLFDCAVTWPHFSHETMSFPPPGALSVSALLQESIALFASLFGQKKKKNQSPSSKFILALIPAVLSVPPLSLCVSHCLSPRPDPRLPNRKSYSLYLPLTSSPTIPCTSQRSSHRCCSGVWGKKLERNGLYFQLHTVSFNLSSL